MAASGRPTPQPERSEHPRFLDRQPEEYPRDDINPYLQAHREFGLPLLPADVAWPLRGRWDDHFGRSAPLHVEIGSGNGFFLSALAAAHPEWNLVGIEIRYKRVVQTAEKLVKARAQEHARIVRYHAGFLDDLFEDGTLEAMYVNHPDPWPKRRHDKNRMISGWFLEDAARFLKPGGVFRLKTDHRPHIDRALELAALPEVPFQVTGQADDVNLEPAPWEDYVTNYQRKFDLKGEPVYAIELTREG